ncbi:hypothetical protein M0R45_024221 [Rubus argutus]|uniref:Uncharacterized protein n=1 Tax=Rubus argutus TaxID=59490 RepID=A0AAW1WQJ3_RUBAR
MSAYGNLELLVEMSRVRQLWQHGGVGDELMREELRGKENRRDEENEIAEASRAAQLVTLLDCIDGSQLATLAVQLHLSAFQPLPSALGFRIFRSFTHSVTNLIPIYGRKLISTGSYLKAAHPPSEMSPMAWYRNWGLISIAAKSYQHVIKPTSYTDSVQFQ